MKKESKEIKRYEMTKEKLIHVFKSVSLFDLSDCEFETNNDEEVCWVNAVKNGSVIDAIEWDGNIFRMMDNGGDFHPLNPMVSAFSAMEEYATQSASQNNQEEGVYAVDLSWGIKYHETDLSNVMESKDCRFIGTGKECADFIRDHKPSSPLPGTTVQGYSEADMEAAYNAGYKRGDDQQNVRTPSGNIYPTFKQFIQSLKH